MSFFRLCRGFVFGLLIALALTALAGENPWHVLKIIVGSAFGSRYDLGLVLFYTTSLIFTGLSVCIAFHAGLFNIGAEGQLAIGTLATVMCGIYAPQIPFPWAPLLAMFCGLLAAGIWGFIPGWLRARRGSHEVIVTMMMNFIAAGVLSYLVVEVLQNHDSQNPETMSVAPSYMLTPHDPIHALSPDSPLNIAFLLAVTCAVLTWLFLQRTVWGFELKAVGENEEAANLAGVNVSRSQILALTISGAVAGLIGVNEILGSSGRLELGFSPDYGFIGIAVALLARNHPLGIILSAFLFAALQKGASDLDMETAVITRDFAKILQAVIILSVAGFSILDDGRIKKWMKKKFISSR